MEAASGLMAALVLEPEPDAMLALEPDAMLAFLCWRLFLEEPTRLPEDSEDLVEQTVARCSHRGVCLFQLPAGS